MRKTEEKNRKIKINFTPIAVLNKSLFKKKSLLSRIYSAIIHELIISNQC